jgi:hypothetical protein
VVEDILRTQPDKGITYRRHHDEELAAATIVASTSATGSWSASRAR